jgi:hypothetical protein
LHAARRVLIKQLMSEPKQRKSGGGCLSKLLFLLLLAAVVGLGSAMWFAVQPQDLSDLESGAQASASNRDLKEVLQSSVDRGFPLTLSEGEINHWLGRTLRSKQEGFLAGKITLDRVWVRLEDERAEVILQRSAWGHPFTVSMYVQLEKMEDASGKMLDIRPQGGPYHPDLPHPPIGGRFGQLVVPQGFLHLVLPAYVKLGQIFPDETVAISGMSKVNIKKGRLVLDPRELLGEQGMPMTF